MQLTPHFSLDEFTHSATAERHGISNDPTPEALRRLTGVTAPGMEQVRAIFGRAIVVTNAYRNPAVNALVGGVPTSDHPQGYAVDFHVAGFSDFAAATKIAAAKGTEILGRPFRYDQLILEGTAARPRCVHISFDPQLRGQTLTQPGRPGTKFHQGIRAL